MMMMKEEKTRAIIPVNPMDISFYYENTYTSIVLDKDGEFRYYDSDFGHTRFPFANLVAFCKAGGKVPEPKVVEKPALPTKARCVECKHLDWSNVENGCGPCLPSSGHKLYDVSTHIFLVADCARFAPAPVGCGSTEQAMLQELLRKTKGDDD